MNKKNGYLKRAELSLLLGIICTVFTSMAHFDAACDDLKQNVIRLHIIANSDSEEDQQVKLKVRDRILEETSELFGENKDITAAEKRIKQNLSKIEKTADETLKQNGCGYTAEATVETAYFNTREYDDFTLPAGQYRSLTVRLGKGEGKNWWCVVFPAVCVSAAEDKGNLSDSVEKNGTDIAEHPKKYVMKFKTVEFYEEIKNKFKEKKTEHRS